MTKLIFSRRLLFAAIAPIAALGSCAPTPPLPPLSNARTQGAAIAAACEGRDGWSDAAPPARIHGTTYYVGTCGITVLLITSPEGHVLIDGATEEAVPAILANIRALGFDPRDIAYIFGSHEHVDHMGGFAALKAATGAQIVVSAAARQVLESGEVDAADPQHGSIPGVPPVAVDATLSFDAVGPQQATRASLTPHPTPGHTSGGTSWTWRSCEGRNCLTFAYVDSLSPGSRDGYRFTDHPERITPFRTTFARVAALPCDVLITPHPSVSNVFERLSGTQPLIDRDACVRLVGTARARFDARLASETEG